jgi:hypothetical protein
MMPFSTMWIRPRYDDDDDDDDDCYVDDADIGDDDDDVVAPSVHRSRTVDRSSSRQRAL